MDSTRSERAKPRSRGDKDTGAFGLERDRMLAFRRDLAAQLAVEAQAFSADGRTFTYEAPVSPGFAAGSFVTLNTPDGKRYVGQILSQEAAIREGPKLSIDLGTDLSGYVEGATLTATEVQAKIRHLAGEGVLLGREEEDRLAAPSFRDVFEGAAIEPASRAAVERFLAATAGRGARLDIGRIAPGDDVPRVAIRADGFDRHTFLCGQSGSGKTYSLGLILERLLMLTDLRMVIIDPNSDFVRLGERRPSSELRMARGAPSYRELAAHHREAARGLYVLRPESVPEHRADVLRVGFGDLTAEEQGAVLQLDPLTDREEYNAFWQMASALGEVRYTLAHVKGMAGTLLTEDARRVALRIGNLGIGEWGLWAGEGERSLADTLAADDWRAVVVDVGTLDSGSQKSVASLAALGHFWRRREERRPVLLVIDEAHNVCPAEPADALQARATELCIAIAGEGRKYGLYLLLSTQRPQKLHPNVLSQCDNLVLMRMNSRADLAEIGEVFSFVPRGLVDEATRFGMGECVLAGKMVPTPLRARLEGRLTREGGADVPTAWAER